MLRNTAPNQSGGERVRRGYAAYTQKTAPTGAEILKVGTIQRPSQEDIHLWFTSGGIKMNPWWVGSTKQTTDLTLNETKSFTGITGSISGATTITITGSDALGLSTTSGYYNGWVVKDTTKVFYALVTAHTYSSAAAGTTTFTVYENVGATGMNWAVTDSFILYRSFHDNLTFSPAYNNDLSNPPTLNTQNSTLRLSGGQSSTNGNRGIIIFPRLTRTFFTGITPFTVDGTYVSERECKANDFLTGATPLTFVASSGSPLTDNSTYWFALACVYDGYQIGPLQRYETKTFYAGNSTNYNYVASGATLWLKPTAQLFAYSLNKRITHILFYVARDDGDTSSAGRKSQYRFVLSIPLSDIALSPATWTFTGGGGIEDYHSIAYSIKQTDMVAVGNTYVIDSGYVEIPTDTMYAYSDEVLVGESRRYLSNVYVTSEAQIDREKLFINPVGGNANINAGLVQPDIFSNEDGIYRKAPEPTIGTKIQAMKAIGLEDLLIIKDRGLLLGRQIVDAAGFPDFLWSIISYEVGCTTIQQAIQADDGWIYFPGYDDIYRYRGGAYQTAIRRGDSNDWLNTYREVITKTQKESTVVWYLPEGVVYFDIAQTNGYQYALYPEFGWRQVCFKQTSGVASTQFFKWMTRLQNGTILGTTSDSPAQFKQFSNPSDLTYYYADDVTAGVGTSIKAQIDTGDFLLAGDESKDARWDKLVIDTTKDVATTGTLDVSVWKDTNLLKTVSGLSKTTIRASVHSASDEARIGQLWRMAWNVNTSDPEVMQSSGKELRINSIDWYADVLPYLKRVSDVPLTGGETCMQTLGTVGGVREVKYLTANTDQTFTFDVPFTDTYLSFDGTNQPKYGITFTRARDNYGTGGEIDTEEVTLISKTLTGFTINVPRGTVLVEFAIV